MNLTIRVGEAQPYPKNLLAPLIGLAIAPTLFGVALLCCGINSTVTATLAGQIVMEGFLEIRLPPWLRRIATRAIMNNQAAHTTTVATSATRSGSNAQATPTRTSAAADATSAVRRPRHRCRRDSRRASLARVSSAATAGTP